MPGGMEPICAIDFSGRHAARNAAGSDMLVNLFWYCVRSADSELGHMDAKLLPTFVVQGSSMLAVFD